MGTAQQANPQSEQPLKQYMDRARLYHYTVVWSPEDETYVARATEWGHLTADGETLVEALEEIVNVVAYALEICEEEGKEAPEPYSLRSFSGKLSLRIPPELHRELSIRADMEGVSLNRLLNKKLGDI